MKLEGIAEGDVLWIGQSGSDLGKIGVEGLEPDKFIWDDDLRAKLA
jgi:hypothetical protein